MTEWTSGCDNLHCAEVLILKTIVKMRNSSDPDGPWLVFTHEEWSSFLDAASRGVFDL